MAKPAIVIVSRFTYRTAPEEFSNKYHFTATPPGTDAAWLTLANQLITALKPCFSPRTAFVRAYGYTDGDHPSIFGHDYTVTGPLVVGTFAVGAQPTAPGDAAAMLRWPTAKRNTRGKIVYARKYFHDVYTADNANGDQLSATQFAAFQTLVTSLQGAGVGGMGPLCLPDGTPVQPGSTSGWITTRTLKRRGKRPPT